MTTGTRSVLVSGASGFIGRRCLPRLLEAGFSVHALSSGHRVPKRTEIEWHQCDLFDAVQVGAALKAARASHLLHLAWITVPGAFWDSQENLRWLSASEELYRAFYAHGGERIVGVGTCAEYEPAAGQQERITESAATGHPQTLYGQCKAAAWSACLAAALVAGREAAWARLFYPYGPGEPVSKLIPSVILGLLRKQRVECTHGLQVRDFIYVDDVADALVALLKGRQAGAYNVGTGRANSVRDTVEVIAATLDRPDFIVFGARTAPTEEPPRLVADIGKLSAALRWQPRVSLQAGIEKTIEELRQCA
jgi:nucleoside-diphosphate-sugar epimerase